MWKRVDGLRTLELGTPGPYRDELNRLVLEGTKAATAGLWRTDYQAEDEPLEDIGERLVMLDSDGEPVAVLEVTRAEVYPFLEVPWELARDEGEGFTSIDDFRAGYRKVYGAAGVTLADDDPMACVWFRLLGPYPAP